jgi:hypothetical protein
MRPLMLSLLKSLYGIGERGSAAALADVISLSLLGKTDISYRCRNTLKRASHGRQDSVKTFASLFSFSLGLHSFQRLTVGNIPENKMTA